MQRQVLESREGNKLIVSEDAEGGLVLHAVQAWPMATVVLTFGEGPGVVNAVLAELKREVAGG